MKLINNSDNNLSHVVDKDTCYILQVGKVLDVPKKVADIWLTYPGVNIFVSPEDVEEEKKKAVEAALKAEKAKQKAEKQTKAVKPKKTSEK